MEQPPKEWGNPESKDIIDLKAVEDLCQQMFYMRDSIQHKEALLSEEKAALRNMQAKMLQILNDHGKSNYKSNHGNVSVMRKLSVKCPKEPVARKDFFDYLKEKGIFEDLVTVHSQTLNAFYKTEWEAAKVSGVMDFAMPGIGEPSYYETLQMRKG